MQTDEIKQTTGKARSNNQAAQSDETAAIAVSDGEGYPKLNPFLFKWRREARLLREAAANWHAVGCEQNRIICISKALVIEQVLADLLAWIEPLSSDSATIALAEGRTPAK